MKRCVYCGRTATRDDRYFHDRYGACRRHVDVAKIERAALNPDQYAAPTMREELQATKGKVT